ncbi:MAG: DUF4367 domain-containing protein [Oscillospiraceae bacterium]|jgi:hypothetical protein|nr:DUF4367 domain-containing protein [Oscillospiraceae bacterium]
MFNKELYKDTFSILKASEDTLLKVQKKINMKKRKPIKYFLVAAIIASLTITTALAVDLPGYIMSLTAGNLIVSRYERGHLPYLDPEVIIKKNLIGVFTIDGVVIEDHEYIKLDSLEAAHEVLGVPLFVPSYLENNEVPTIIRKATHTFGNSVEVYYGYDIYNQEHDIITNRTNAFFILAQTYVGEGDVTFDVFGDFVKVMINDYEAIMYGKSNTSLYWIQDGIFIQLLPSGLNSDYVIKIAESLIPMQ